MLSWDLVPVSQVGIGFLLHVGGRCLLAFCAGRVIHFCRSCAVARGAGGLLMVRSLVVGSGGSKETAKTLVIILSRNFYSFSLTHAGTEVSSNLVHV